MTTLLSSQQIVPMVDTTPQLLLGAKSAERTSSWTTLLPKIRPLRKKSVSISPTSQMYMIDEETDEDRRARWYSKDEYEMFQRDIRFDLRNFHLSRTTPQPKCPRGLEPWVTDWQLSVLRKKYTAVGNISASSVQAMAEAIQRAQDDHREVRGNEEEERTDEEDSTALSDNDDDDSDMEMDYSGDLLMDDFPATVTNNPFTDVTTAKKNAPPLAKAMAGILDALGTVMSTVPLLEHDPRCAGM